LWCLGRCTEVTVCRFGSDERRGGGLGEVLVQGSGGRCRPVTGLASACPGARSGEGGKRADAGERVVEVLLPGPAGGHPECPLPGGAGQSTGDSEESVAAGVGGAGAVLGQADQAGPSSEVVRQRGDHGPGAVRGVPAGGEVRERLVFEIADRELDDGVLTMVGLDQEQRLGAVGREREVLAVRKQLGLLADQTCAADDQPPITELGLGDLRLPGGCQFFRVS